jgi:hypothetical protein
MAKKKMNPLEKVAKRFGVTAREARDIATAVSTLGRSVANQDQFTGARKRGKGLPSLDPIERRKLAAKNLAKQVGEVYTAATKGKSGTKSAQLKSKKDERGLTKEVRLVLPTKRKQGGKK